MKAVLARVADLLYSIPMKILVGMSGGVDSSVAAALLKEQGHEVEGAYMKNWINEDNIAGNCPWMEDIEDARNVAEHLGIPFRVVNLMKEYRERVVDYLLRGYSEGVTPNPDVMCNREMKFGVFLEYAREAGFDAVGTGHYARIDRNQSHGRARILRGCDPNKDQSYFLAMLRQEQADSAAFPLGDLAKPEVREIARKLGLPTAGKKDSQGICFIGEIRMRDFLQTYLPDSPGPIVDLEGRVLGEHKGLHLYTLGQRKGHGVASPRHGVAYVVVAKRPQTNELVVGYDLPSTEGLYASECTLHSLSWTGEPLAPTAEGHEGHLVFAQPRYRTQASPARLWVDADGRSGRLEFERPRRALTPGQVCALYAEDDQVLLGGAVFGKIG